MFHNRASENPALFGRNVHYSVMDVYYALPANKFNLNYSHEIL